MTSIRFSPSAWSFLSITMAGLFISLSAFSQIKVLPDTSKMKYNEISSGLKLAVFPSKQQSQDQQKKDEFECYKWAAEQSGIDPMSTPAAKAETVDTSPDGTAAKGAAKGALVGLAIGSVSGNAGAGAAIGAGLGGARGAKQKGYTDARKQQQANANADAKNQDMVNSYIKAFSVCMEGKGYSVK